MSITTNSTRALGVFSLAMITAVSVDSVRNLPATALFGSSLIFFFILGAIFFLLPCALVSAELRPPVPNPADLCLGQKCVRSTNGRVGNLAAVD